jgi:hypothetical protein
MIVYEKFPFFMPDDADDNLDFPCPGQHQQRWCCPKQLGHARRKINRPWISSAKDEHVAAQFDTLSCLGIANI